MTHDRRLKAMDSMIRLRSQELERTKADQIKAKSMVEAAEDVFESVKRHVHDMEEELRHAIEKDLELSPLAFELRHRFLTVQHEEMAHVAEELADARQAMAVVSDKLKDQFTQLRGLERIHDRRETQLSKDESRRTANELDDLCSQRRR